jgi:hypothetical protein
MGTGRLVCCQCLTIADDRARGWRAYRADVEDHDPAPIVVFYCGGCAELMFGAAPTAQREVRQLVRALRHAAETSTGREADQDGPAVTRAVGRYLRRRFAR